MDPTPLFTFDELVARLAPGFALGRWKVVRHLETARDAPDFAELVATSPGALEFYQRHQGADVFGRCAGIFSFVGLPGGRALFFGAYTVEGPAERPELAPDDPAVPAILRPLWRRWADPTQPGTITHRYSLRRDPCFAPLEGRVVVDWGRAALSWHQWKTDKAVLELREPGRIAPCPQYPDIDVSLAKIAFLAANEAANPSWVSKLGAVGGIYLLTDHRSGRLYVGQAGAEGQRGGFWSRWKQYAAGASGNVQVDAAVADGSIRPADPEVTLSVLEVVPLGKASKGRLDAREARWKRRLATRGTAHGLNDN